MKPSFALVFSLAVLGVGQWSQAETNDLDTQLMLATFKLSGSNSAATCFLLTRPVQDASERSGFVLVTAGHVLEQIKGDEATIAFRKREPDGGYSKLPVKLAIRQNGKPKWTKHPSADVAVMDVTPPSEACIGRVPIELLASDQDLQRYEIHPGDRGKCVGFPHPNQFEANHAGFPLVRAGCIASYPLLPTKSTKAFFLDFNTFEGDSGGPVYLSESNRFYGAKTHDGRTQLVLGIAIAQQFIDEEFKLVYQTGKFRHQMGLSIVAHATAIREAIDLLDRNRSPSAAR